LASFETARNKKVCPFAHFWPFFNVEENSLFKGLSWKNLTEFIKFKLFILLLQPIFKENLGFFQFSILCVF